MKKPRKTQPASADLAKNVPPLVREYIDARFKELSDAIDRRFTNLRRINMASVKVVKEIREDARDAVRSLDVQARKHYKARRSRPEEAQ